MSSTHTQDRLASVQVIDMPANPPTGDQTIGSQGTAEGFHGQLELGTKRRLSGKCRVEHSLIMGAEPGAVPSASVDRILKARMVCLRAKNGERLLIFAAPYMSRSPVMG
jgi:hypothetical protein